MMRLDKYLSERLGIPRGESRKLAAKGRVTVNGVLTKKADTQIEGSHCRGCRRRQTVGRGLPGNTFT